MSSMDYFKALEVIKKHGMVTIGESELKTQLALIKRQKDFIMVNKTLLFHNVDPSYSEC